MQGIESVSSGLGRASRSGLWALAAFVSASLLQACGGGGEDTGLASPAAIEMPQQEMQPIHIVGDVLPDAPSDLEKPAATTAPRYLTPAMTRKAYGLDQVYAADNPATQGAGQTIAIIAAYHNPGIASDLALFSSRFGLPACGTGCFSVVYTRNGVRTVFAPAVNKNWAVESSLDVEWAHAIAPLAKIVLVEAASASYQDLLGAAYYAANTLGAGVVTMSFGGSEWSGEAAVSNAYFRNTRTAFVAATGDSGHGTAYPSVSPYVLAVGGTTLAVSPAGDYGGEVAWSGSGGGISAYESALPIAWPTVTPVNVANSWLTAPAPGGRPVPDVSFNADPAIGFFVVSQTGIGAGYYAIVGGTSAGAPQWAGLIAIASALRAQAGKPVLNTAQGVADNGAAVNTALAQLSSNGVGASAYAALFYDITALGNGSCGLLCNASAGWDLVTGIGSPNAATLLPALVAY